MESRGSLIIELTLLAQSATDANRQVEISNEDGICILRFMDNPTRNNSNTLVLPHRGNETTAYFKKSVDITSLQAYVLLTFQWPLTLSSYVQWRNDV